MKNLFPTRFNPVFSIRFLNGAIQQIKVRVRLILAIFLCMFSLSSNADIVHTVTQSMLSANGAVCCPSELAAACGGMVWSSVNTIYNNDPNNDATNITIQNALYLPSGLVKPDHIYVTSVNSTGEYPLIVNTTQQVTFIETLNTHVSLRAASANSSLTGGNWVGYESTSFLLKKNDSLRYRLVYVWNSVSTKCYAGYQWNTDNQISAGQSSINFLTPFTVPNMIVCKVNAKCNVPFGSIEIFKCNPPTPAGPSNPFYVLYNGSTSDTNNINDGIYTGLVPGSYTLYLADSVNNIYTDSNLFTITIDPNDTTYFSANACDSYTWAMTGITYTASGIYTTTYIDTAGCTSLAILNLTLTQTTSSYEIQVALNSYTWPLNGVTYTISGLYDVTSVNAAGCLHTSYLQLIIYSGGFILSIAEDQPISCNGNNDGSIQATASPTGSYTYILDFGLDSNTTGLFSNLSPGTHVVLAVNNSAPFDSVYGTIILTEPDPLAMTFVTDSLVSCLGNDGQLSVNITGGTNVLQGYLTWWTNALGDTLNDVLTDNFAVTIDSLSAGYYNVAVEDDHGCFYNSGIYIEVAAPILVGVVDTPIVCHNGTTVLIPFSIGGVPYLPMTYLVNGAPIGATYASGTYTITATDAKGCAGSTVITLSNPVSISDFSSVSACNSYTWNGITYTANGAYTGTFTSANGCDSIHTLTLTLTNGVSVSPKAFLSAPYVSAAGMMHDSLRVKGLIPLMEPYTSLSFTPIASSGGETVSAAMLAVTGSDAIVDWVHIEIRSGAPSYMKVATQNALLQRDGDIVDVSGSPLYFSSLCPGDYYVSVKHRNHLGVMTASALTLSASTQLVDFTTSASVWSKPGVSNAARETNGSYRLLWPGDTRTNKNVKYNGLSNDKEPILYAVGISTPNNILEPVYRQEDATMDGRVKYNNSDNDKNFILNKILLSNYPVSTPNDVLSQHTPN